jgi:uncharacterized C2H2 Zn-finger protein
MARKKLINTQTLKYYRCNRCKKIFSKRKNVRKHLRLDHNVKCSKHPDPRRKQPSLSDYYEVFEYENKV